MIVSAQVCAGIGDVRGQLPDGSGRIVVIDAGHGGLDAGVQSHAGLTEKSLTLAIASKFDRRLKAGIKAAFTRTGDYELDPFERVSKANALKADLFISLHAAGGSSPSENGPIVYYFGEMGGRIYPKEIVPESAGGLEADKILWDFQHLRHRAASKRLAELLQKRMEQRPGSKGCRIQEAPLILLSGADMPAVVLEVGYLTHPEEGLLLNRPEVIDGIAEAVSLAIYDFFENSDPN